MDNITFYNKLIKKYKVKDPRSLGWGSRESQGIRFSVLAGIGIGSKDTVLDIGCGYGDFSHAVDNGNYIGFDICPEMIKEARKRYPDQKFITEWKDETADWVIASGVFNLKDADMALIPRMFLNCNKGISLNFLCRYKGMEEKDDRIYHDPADIIKTVEKLSNKWVLRHDYRHNDFTIYVWR
jgi:SAM-dependent methyltransferase